MIIGEGLKAIHSQAFKGVTNVKLIAFPHDIYSIDSDAFDLDFYKGDGKVPIKADTLSGKIWKGIGNGDLYLNGVQKTQGLGTIIYKIVEFSKEFLGIRE